MVLCFEPLTLSLTHPGTYTHAPSHFYKEKIHQLDSWSFLFLTSLWSFMSLCISNKLSHFNANVGGGLFPLGVLFDNMGHWCYSHITHKHQSMYVLTDMLCDIDNACPEVQHKHLCQIQIHHRHTRAHGWTDGRTSDQRRPWTLYIGRWLTS